MLNELLLGRAIYCRDKHRHDQASESRWAQLSRATAEWIRARRS
tara:strand:+ start:1597 stop:1728 length:132 start_codon:yes stop_codon:yes gene_type:complete